MKSALKKVWLGLVLLYSSLAVGEPKKPVLVYHTNYDISFLGLEKVHPFDTHKYSKVYDYLNKKNILKKVEVLEPKPVSNQDLLKVHTHDYLNSLGSSKVVAHISGVELLSWLPNFVLQRGLLQPMKYATGGTILAAEQALEHGLAINLSGGYHHAKRTNGEGFCYFADIPLAVYNLWEKKPDLNIMIIDLDAHQGNGVSTVFNKDPRVTIVDGFNKDTYPAHDWQARALVDYPIPFKPYTADKEYLGNIKITIMNALGTKKPDLIIYNAGTDIFEEDPLGHLSVSAAGIIERDRFVFSTAHDNNIPLAMVLSGGYSPKSAEIIGKSLENILVQL